MFEALREITTRSPAGDLVRIGPGEPVADFHEWPLTNQIAAVTTHMVRRVRPGLALSYRSNPGELMQERDRLIADAIARHESRTPVQSATDMDLKAEVPNPDPLQCEECDYSTHSAQGLKTHRARKHR